MSTARFVGGPWNGQTREIPDRATRRWLVAIADPPVWRGAMDRPDAVSYRRVTYVRAAMDLAGNAVYVPAEPVEVCEVDRMRNAITVTIAFEALENMDARDLLGVLRQHAFRQTDPPPDWRRTRDLLNAEHIARTFNVPRELLDDAPPSIHDEIVRRMRAAIDRPPDQAAQRNRREPTQAEIVREIEAEARRPAQSSDPADAMGTPHYASEHRCPDCDVEWTGTPLCWSCGKDTS